MTMVSIILCFTRAQRDGSRDFHLYTFKRMLPFLFRYDHVNYARWVTVYMAEMLLSTDLVDTLLAFHAITGCDSVSQFSDHGKNTAWAVFKQHHTDLIGLRKGSLTENVATSTEKFICQIYGVPEVDTSNIARVMLFSVSRTQETLPATNIRCSKVSHHAVPLSSKCLEPSTLAVS